MAGSTRAAAIGRVFGRAAGHRTDHVAEVEERRTRHDRVEVDDAQGLAGRRVEEDVAQLGVVVHDALGHLAAGQRIEQQRRDLGVLADERDLLGHRPRPPGRVAVDSVFEAGEASRRVVKAGDRLFQSRRGKIRQQA